MTAEQRHEPQHGGEGAAKAANGAGMGRQLKRAGAGRLRNEFNAPQFQEIHVIAAGRMREGVGQGCERRKWRIKPTAVTSSSATKARVAATPSPPPMHINAHHHHQYTYGWSSLSVLGQRTGGGSVCPVWVTNGCIVGDSLDAALPMQI